MAEVQRMTWMTSTRTTPYGKIHECHTPTCSSLGRDCMENLRFTKNQLLNSAKQFFQVTEKLIKDQTEISGLTTETATKITKVLCPGSISDQPVEVWKNKNKWYLETRCLKDLNRIDGEVMEFEWKSSQDSLHWEFSKLSKIVTEVQCEPEQFKGNRLHVNVQRQNVLWILLQLRIMLADSCSHGGHFWDLDQRRNCTELLLMNNFLKTRNCPNSAPTSVWRLLIKDNSSLHLKKKDQMKWRICVVSTRYLVAKKHPEWEGVDSRKNENRPGLGCEGLPSSKTLRYRNHGRDRTVSWVRMVNGTNKYVTETSETISLENVEHKVRREPVAKAKPQPKLTVTLSPISIPVRERNWIDIHTERFRQDCFTLSKAMIRILRHDPSINREDDGAVRFDDLMEELKAKFDGTWQWSIFDWITSLAKGGGPKKRLQYFLNPNSSKHFLYFRAIQGHQGGNLVDLELLTSEMWVKYIQ